MKTTNANIQNFSTQDLLEMNRGISTLIGIQIDDNQSVLSEPELADVLKVIQLQKSLNHEIESRLTFETLESFEKEGGQR